MSYKFSTKNLILNDNHNHDDDENDDENENGNEQKRIFFCFFLF